VTSPVPAVSRGVPGRVSYMSHLPPGSVFFASGGGVARTPSRSRWGPLPSLVMAVPDFQTLTLPVLEVFGDGDEHTSREVRERVAEALHLEA
jgi:hypothetical protein